MVTVTEAADYIEVKWSFDGGEHTVRISKSNGLITYYDVDGVQPPLKDASLVAKIHPRFYDGSQWWYPSLSPSSCSVSIAEQTDTRVVVEAETKLRNDAGSEADNPLTITYTIEDGKPIHVMYSIGSGSITSISRIVHAFELTETTYPMTADRAIYEKPFTDTSGEHYTSTTRESWVCYKAQSFYICAVCEDPYTADTVGTETFYRTADAVFDANIFMSGLSLAPPTDVTVYIVITAKRGTAHRLWHDLHGASHDWKQYDVVKILGKYKAARYMADNPDIGHYEKAAYVAFHLWLALYEITNDSRYLDKAKAIADDIIANRFNSSLGVFVHEGGTAWDHENGVMCMLLLRLYELTSDSKYLDYVKSVLQTWFSKRKDTGELPEKYYNGTWTYMSETSYRTYPELSSDAYMLVSAYYWYKKLTGDGFADDYISTIENYYAQFWDDTQKAFYIGANTDGVVKWFSVHQLNSHHAENVYMRLKAGANPSYAELFDTLLKWMYRADDVHAGFYVDYLDEDGYPVFGTVDGRTLPWALNALNALNVAVWLARLIREGMLTDDADKRAAIKESAWYGVAALDDNGYNPLYTKEDEVVTSASETWLAPYLGGYLMALWADGLPIPAEFPSITSYSWDGSKLTLEGDAGDYEIIFKHTGRKVTDVKLNGASINFTFDPATGVLQFTASDPGTIEVYTAEETAPAQAVSVSARVGAVPVANSGVLLVARYVKKRSAARLRLRIEHADYTQSNEVDVSAQSLDVTDTYTFRLLGPSTFWQTIDLGSLSAVETGMLGSGESKDITGKMVAVVARESTTIRLRVTDTATGRTREITRTLDTDQMAVYISVTTALTVTLAVDSGAVDYYLYDVPSMTTKDATLRAQELDASGNILAEGTATISLALINITGSPSVPSSSVELVEALAIY